MRLMIAIPALDMMNTTFVGCLLGLINKLHDDGACFEVEICSGSLVHLSRDKLARKAIEKDFTHVLWLDSDMVFEADVLDNLMKTGKSFVTAICHARRPPFPTCLFASLTGEAERYSGEYPDTPFEVAGCGLACVLIETRILKDVMNAYLTCFTPLKDYGEDLAFCLRAAGLGYKIYAEPGVRVGHIGSAIIYPEDHKNYLATHGGETNDC